MEVHEREGGQLFPNLVHFARLLRRLGIAASGDQTATFTRALRHLDLGSRRDVKAAARAIYLSRHEQQALFDRAFDLFFHPHHRAGSGLDLGQLVERSTRVEPRKIAPLATPANGEVNREAEQPVLEPTFTFSQRELLRHKDFAELTAEETIQLQGLLRRFPLEVESRRTRRQQRARQGRLFDFRRTLRASLRYGGETARLAWKHRRYKPRPLVVLCDVSGSMENYSRILLQFLYAVGQNVTRYQAFAFGTRLTCLTRPLALRDVDSALRQAAALVVDWGGGTRIGESLHRFNYDWGRRVLGQGAVVLLISDGWDRGDTALLASEIARLQRSCERLIWLNPLLGQPGYQPLTRGMAAALPHVDDFLPVHNLASLEALGRHLAELNTPSTRPPRLARTGYTSPMQQTISTEIGHA